MKILLVAINAKYIHSNPAVYSLRGYIKREKPDLASLIDVAEYTINNQKDAVLADIYLRKPDVIGISCYIWNIEMVLRLLPEIKKVLPEAEIWLGGPEVTYNPKQVLLENKELRGVFVGEGEQSFLEVSSFYAYGEGELSKTNGVCFYEMNSEKVEASIVNTQVQPLTDLDSLPFLYQNPQDFDNKIIYYESSRGCPFRCSYCLSSIDKTVRFRNVELVKKELAFFLEKKVPQVKFVDRTFNCNKKRSLEIWQFIKDNDNGITNFHFEVAADLLTDEELELLLSLRPGAVQLEIGVQSTNLKTIEEIHRTMDFERVKEITLKLHQGKNVHAHLDLIAGLPYEGYESFAKSFNDVFSCYPEQLQLGFLKVLKGSFMHENAKEYGLVYTDTPPYEVLYTKWLSYEEVLFLKKVEEMVELYYNSNQYKHILPVLYPFFDSAFDLFENLARFYEKNGYFIQTPARMYRYDVLLAFARQVAPQLEDLWREVFTYDAYLRENCKKRPEFAPDMTEYKRALRELTKDQKSNHVEIFTYPVWEIEDYEVDFSKTIQKLETPQAVLFHYEERSRLTYEASVELVEMPKEE